MQVTSKLAETPLASYSFTKANSSNCTIWLSNHSFDSLSDDDDVKIDDESKSFASELQISKHLRFKHWMHFLNGFHLDDYGLLHQQIQSQRLFKHYSVINNRNQNLPPNP